MGDTRLRDFSATTHTSRAAESLSLAEMEDIWSNIRERMLQNAVRKAEAEVAALYLSSFRPHFEWPEIEPPNWPVVMCFSDFGHVIESTGPRYLYLDCVDATVEPLPSERTCYMRRLMLILCRMGLRDSDLEHKRGML